MNKAIYIQCNGEAHRNPYIDNCGVCLPFWSQIPVCPTDRKKLTDKGSCSVCKKRFDLSYPHIVETVTDVQRKKDL